MALQYKPAKDSTFFDPEEGLTEQEHKDSCDINKMIKSINRGQTVRGGRSNQYGYDDTTNNGLNHRIQKDQLERELDKQFATTEFSEEEAQAIPPSVAKKYAGKIKIRKKTNDETKSKQNDETKTDPNPPANSNPPSDTKKPT